jgi:hypothetical protein
VDLYNRTIEKHGIKKLSSKLLVLILPYLEKNEEYDPNYLKNESTSRKYLQALKDELDKKIAPIKLRLYQITNHF